MRHRSETDKRTETIAPTCWHRESSCTCLRVEISATESHLFPYQQFITASLARENATDVLRLAFPSHDIEITGRNLRELLVALQEFTVKWVRIVPERYQSVMSNEPLIVSSIRITVTG
jgi:hypothetical protein